MFKSWGRVLVANGRKGRLECDASHSNYSSLIAFLKISCGSLLYAAEIEN